MFKNAKFFIVGILGLFLGYLGIDGTDSIYVNFAGLVVATPVISEWIIETVKAKKFLAQFISWVIGIVLSLVGWWLNLGFLAGLLWWHVVLVGVAVSLAANGVWDIDVLKKLLEGIGALKPKK